MSKEQSITVASCTRAYNHQGESYDNLKKYPKPRPTFKKTKACEEVLELVKHNKILHLHGMSGSGKSQTLAGACEELDINPARIIWHVQCEERSGALERESTELMARLQRKELISPDTERNLMTALHEDHESYPRTQVKSLINELNKNLSVPLLLVIEDVEHDDEKNFIRTLITCMGDFIQDILKIQLFIATQDKHAIYSTLDLNALGIYRTYHVRGFSEEEAFDFLCTNMQISDKAKVGRLAEELAYSPLGLFVVKSYCQKYKLSYEKYYDSLEKYEDVERQKKLMKLDADLRGKNHRYDIIVKLLAPRRIEDEDEQIQSQVILMLSFVSNEHIPTQMIRRFFFAMGQREYRQQELSTLVLIERLEREVDALPWKKENDEKSLVVHSDVLRALRMSMDADKKADLLSDVVTALASILDKDNRVKDTYLLLHDLKNHAESVVSHCLERFDVLHHNFVAQPKDCEILLGMSKINEVIGFAISQHQGMREGFEEDDYYERAIVCIWTVVSSNTSSSLWSSLRSRFKRKAQKEDNEGFLIDYKKGKDPATTAKKAFKMIRDASLANDEIKKILQNDSEKSYPVKKTHFAEMKDHLGDASGVNWSKLEKEIDENGRLSDQSKKLLQEKKMLLRWDQLNPYYLTERIASILHSRGRLDNYKGDIISPEMHERCIWYVDLGLALCDITFQETGISPLFRFILRANNQLPRMVRNKQDESDEEFMRRIYETRDFAHAVRQEKSDFYEHGIYKRVGGTAWTSLNALKYLVKANTKVHKRPHLLERFPTEAADRECEELYEICKNNPQIMISTTCLVHAGKYSAARRYYARAIEMFRLAFKQGIDRKLQANPPAYAWALFNMGRTIAAAGSSLSDRQTVVKDFKRRYDLTKSNKTPDKWRKILDNLYAEMQ